jgi:hypothetical protein
VKPHWHPVTDAAEIAALVAAGKYREHLPFWIRAGDVIWVLKAEKKSQ